MISYLLQSGIRGDPLSPPRHSPAALKGGWFSGGTARLLTTLLLGVAYWILARSVGYAHGAIWRYVLYVVLAVWLPGQAMLTLALGRRTSLVNAIAIGLPLGFAWEIALYLGCAAAGARGVYPLVLAGTALALLALSTGRAGWRGIVPEWGAGSGWATCALAACAVAFMGLTAAWMYAPAPLWGGRLLQPTHQDWAYLLSLAGNIGRRWPIEDPNLAGTPLAYHHFLLVHVAAAARATGLEVSLVLLRLAVVPLGAALLVQVYALGRVTGRSAWAGVLAVALLFMAGEVSLTETAMGGSFQSLFVPWLFISPTFFFGMIYTGAVLLWFRRIFDGDSLRIGDWLVLAVLAVFGTGAKGTAMGPIVAAAGPWLGWLLVRRRRWSWPVAGATAVVFGGFALGFTAVLHGWSGGGGVVWSPLAFVRVSPFWLEHASAWKQTLGSLGLPGPWAGWLAGAVCVGVIFAGLNGLLLLGLAQPWLVPRGRARRWAAWLAAVALGCVLFGHLLFLDSHGETYLYLPLRLPLAVLAGAALVALWRRGRSWLGEAQALAGARTVGIVAAGLLLGLLVWRGFMSAWAAVLVDAALLFAVAPSPRSMGAAMPAPRGRLAVWLLPGLIAAGLAVVQVGQSLQAASGGLRLWRDGAAAGRDADFAQLREAMVWVRRQTPPNAVLVVNAFVPELADPARPAGVLDRTTLDKHYYYSALAHRSLFVGGPAYTRDLSLAERRMKAISDYLRTGRFEGVAELADRPFFLVVDRQASQALPRVDVGRALYSNARIAIYRINPPPSAGG